MFVDASAMVAILESEPEKDSLAQRINRAGRCTTSAIAVWETTVRLMRKTDMKLAEAQAAVTELMIRSGIELVVIGPDESALALEAYDRFGKGRGHPAQLNLGDCFAYACAKAHGVELLYVGNDFSQTDVNG